MIENRPYLTLLWNKKINKTIIAVIQLRSRSYISYYDLNRFSEEELKEFIKLCDIWWMNAPNIPITLYFKEKMKHFAKYLEYLATSESAIFKGFTGVTLKNLTERRIKRKVIILERTFGN